MGCLRWPRPDLQNLQCLLTEHKAQGQHDYINDPEARDHRWPRAVGHMWPQESRQGLEGSGQDPRDTGSTRWRKSQDPSPPPNSVPGEHGTAD